jgi:serine/threonine protein kinase
LVTGGRLIDRIKKYGHFPERDAAIILATLCNTVSYLHAMDIVHRDIRADVVLYKEADPESIMYLGNFDMACHVPEGGVKGEVGTVANAGGWFA